MSDWTPGPWVPLYDDRVSVPEDTNGSLSIAHVYACRERPANQRLIAAAPELADALRECDAVMRAIMERYHDPKSDCWFPVEIAEGALDALRAARSALAKLEKRP